eukprot:CAMPEP_0168789970 /NCGR_PEP_ID=MMETSP0725-20121227/13140_1 /TAXON_ID=265536 /ORGANISM="Amphiprora sp., Strain CCMP467" /LENGTH=232 /DNA_ID=CAMNT_0008840323 /DNA_START=35 /DNA_END=733 /DNA_ORIENTATION=+
MPLQQLRTLQKALSKATSQSDQGDAGELRDILRRLSEFGNMTVEYLEQTKIGFTVKRLKRHPVVGDQARALLKQWNQALSAEQLKTTVPTEAPHDAHQSSATTSTNTVVCNVKVAFIRPQGYQNLKDWTKDPKNVYIGRAGVVFVDKKRFPPKASLWCNPFKLKRDGSNLSQVLEDYESHLRQRLKTEAGLEERLQRELDGKCLGCWCKPSGCHGDILIKIMNELSAKKDGH